MDRLAKTMASIVGVLFPAKALGGYIDAKSGKHLAFTIVASNSVFSSIEGAFAANGGADFDCRLSASASAVPTPPRPPPSSRARRRVPPATSPTVGTAFRYARSTRPGPTGHRPASVSLSKQPNGEGRPRSP
jgi:hypothetical protein